MSVECHLVSVSMLHELMRAAMCGLLQLTGWHVEDGALQWLKLTLTCCMCCLNEGRRGLVSTCFYSHMSGMCQARQHCVCTQEPTQL